MQIDGVLYYSQYNGEATLNQFEMLTIGNQIDVEKQPQRPAPYIRPARSNSGQTFAPTAAFEAPQQTYSRITYLLSSAVPSNVACVICIPFENRQRAIIAYGVPDHKGLRLRLITNDVSLTIEDLNLDLFLEAGRELDVVPSLF